MEVNEIKMLAKNTFNELMDEFWENIGYIAYDNNLEGLDRDVFFEELRDLVNKYQ